MSVQLVLERQPRCSTERRRIDRDDDLLDALRSGDPRAAECLVSRYGERAYRLARRITGNGQDAEEVVQDAFWSVVRKIDTFRGDSAFGSWLYRIVANAAPCWCSATSRGDRTRRSPKPSGSASRSSRPARIARDCSSASGSVSR